MALGGVAGGGVHHYRVSAGGDDEGNQVHLVWDQWQNGVSLKRGDFMELVGSNADKVAEFERVHGVQVKIEQTVDGLDVQIVGKPQAVSGARMEIVKVNSPTVF
jgi:hypothetical protein